MGLLSKQQPRLLDEWRHPNDLRSEASYGFGIPFLPNPLGFVPDTDF